MYGLPDITLIKICKFDIKHYLISYLHAWRRKNLGFPLSAGQPSLLKRPKSHSVDIFRPSARYSVTL